MDILLIFGLSLIAIIILLLIPAMGISMLLMVPLIKPAAVTYIPLFRTIDLTVMVNVIVALLGIWTYFRAKVIHRKLNIPWPLLISLVIIIVVFLIGLMWTTAPLYGEQKTIRMLGIGLPFLILPALFIRTNEHAMSVMRVLILVAGFVALVLLFGPDVNLHTERYGSYYDRKTFLGSDPNTPSVVVMVGILLVVLYMVAGIPSKWVKQYGMIFIPLGVLAILASGSRANIIGLFTALLFIPFLNKGSMTRNFTIIAFVTLIVILALAAILTFLNIDIPMMRWLGFFEQLKEGDLTSTRTPAWIFCITEAWDKYALFGHGPGSYAKDFIGADAQYYPHNIILEALYEAGVVGMVAIITFLYLCFRIARKGMMIARNKEERFLVAAPSAIVLAMSVTAMTHWNLDSARFLYLFAGILSVTVASIIDQVRYERSSSNSTRYARGR